MDLTPDMHCGAVRYRIVGEPLYVPYCHCESCRKITGSAAVVRVCMEAHKVELDHDRVRYFESSPGVRRGFCPRCGTPLTWEGVWGGKARIEVYIGTLDNPQNFRPDRHAFCRHRLDWFEVEDNLPRYDRGSPTEPL